VLAPQRISIYIKGRVSLWLGHTGALAHILEENTNAAHYIPNGGVKHLHQLQNLYFALTDDELNYVP
jgi:hypothetical protein